MKYSFKNADGRALAASIFEPLGESAGQQLILLLHGGGQTRHSWKGTAEKLAEKGHRAITLDLRGHGDSDWSADGEYSFESYGADTASVVRQLVEKYQQKPIIIGASLGGMSAMVFAGEGGEDMLTGLVLVDITPSMKVSGVEKILGFMAEHAQTGFASLEEAADVIAAYLPHRPRPKDLSGLKKNLRLGKDGRYRWHWDPAFIESRRKLDRHGEVREKLEAAVHGLKLPVMLVRGRDSELVGEEEVAHFLELVPHAKIADVSGARHMVAGDKNDIFSDAVISFIAEL